MSILFGSQCIWIVAIMLLVSDTAFAYVDPGSGYLIIQLIIAAFVGCLFYVKRIVAFVRSIFSGKKFTSDKTGASKTMPQTHEEDGDRHYTSNQK